MRRWPGRRAARRPVMASSRGARSATWRTGRRPAMRKLSAFIHVTLDGCYGAGGGDMRLAHAGSDNPEWQAFVEGNAQGSGVLVFGRVTYEMMAGYWPSPMARQQNPVVAERMNASSKIVFSRGMDKPSWSNTVLV